MLQDVFNLGVPRRSYLQPSNKYSGVKSNFPLKCSSNGDTQNVITLAPSEPSALPPIQLQHCYKSVI